MALHLQSLELGTADVTRRGKALGEPRNKRGRASWLDDGTIQLGMHGADAPPTMMHMALTHPQLAEWKRTHADICRARGYVRISANAGGDEGQHSPVRLERRTRNPGERRQARVLLHAKLQSSGSGLLRRRLDAGADADRQGSFRPRYPRRAGDLVPRRDRPGSSAKKPQKKPPNSWTR